MAEPAQDTGPEIELGEGFLTARDGLQIFWRSWSPPSPKAHVFLVHGYSDHSGRYLHVGELLAKSGYAVHAPDCRGHGRSGGRRGHIDRFTDYLDDVEDFSRFLRPKVGEKKLFVVAHSHGALIIGRWLLDRPDGIAGVVFSSPFIRLGFDPPALKVFVAKLIGKVIPFLPIGNELHVEDLSSDEAWQEKTRQDELYLSKTTPRWFTEAQLAQEELLRRASEIVAPMLILQAGADPIVAPAASRELFDAITSSDKEWESYEGFKHELFNEVERQRPLGRMIKWLDERV